MEGWVAGGGVLVLPGGPGAGANLKGMPERLMPVITGAAAELERSLALERLAHEPLPAAFTIPVIDSQPVSGQVLAQEGEVPLAVLKRYGQGSVLFLAFDPSAQPLVGWTGMSGDVEETVGTVVANPPSFSLTKHPVVVATPGYRQSVGVMLRVIGRNFPCTTRPLWSSRPSTCCWG